MLAALLGVHGVGKTTVARQLELRHDVKVVYMDYFLRRSPLYKEFFTSGGAHATDYMPWDTIRSFDGDTRELYFLAKYSEALIMASLAARGSDKIILLDNHPLAVVAYCHRFCTKVEPETVLELILKLPRVDKLVVLFADPEVILERVKARSREGMVDEEAQLEYIRVVQKDILGLTAYVGKAIAKEIHVVDASGCIEDVLSKVERILGLK